MKKNIISFVTIDEGFISAGWSNSTDIPDVLNHNLLDCWIVKLNSQGDL